MCHSFIFKVNTHLTTYSQFDNLICDSDTVQCSSSVHHCCTEFIVLCRRLLCSNDDSCPVAELDLRFPPNLSLSFRTGGERGVAYNLPDCTADLDETRMGNDNTKPAKERDCHSQSLPQHLNINICRHHGVWSGTSDFSYLSHPGGRYI